MSRVSTCHRRAPLSKKNGRRQLQAPPYASSNPALPLKLILKEVVPPSTWQFNTKMCQFITRSREQGRAIWNKGEEHTWQQSSAASFHPASCYSVAPSCWIFSSSLTVTLRGCITHTRRLTSSASSTLSAESNNVELLGEAAYSNPVHT